MKEETLYSFRSPYRESFRILAYSFRGTGEGAGLKEPSEYIKSCAVLGGVHGSDIQQMYTCACLINELTALEHAGAVARGHEIVVLPCVNHYAVNSGKKFCTKCDKDINRTFPGKPMGENVERVSSVVWARINDFANCIQVTGGELPRGSFCTHLRIEDCVQNDGVGEMFRLPYIMYDKSERREDTTLVNNIISKGNMGNAVSVLVNNTAEIDNTAARSAVCGILLYMFEKGILACEDSEKQKEVFINEIASCGAGGSLRFYKEKQRRVISPKGGIFRRFKRCGQHAEKGEILGEVLHTYKGTILSSLRAPVAGKIFYSKEQPLISENCLAFILLGE